MPRILDTLFRILAFILFVAALVSVGLILHTMPALSADRSGLFREMLALPNGMEINPLSQDEVARYGACGPWGCKPHERTGETVNNQFNPSDRAGGSYTNSGAMNLRYATKADADGGLRLAIVDAFDQRPTTGFTATLRAWQDGRMRTVGQFHVRERETSGAVHYLAANLGRAYRRVVVLFTTTSAKAPHGDIVAVGRGACHG